MKSLQMILKSRRIIPARSTFLMALVATTALAGCSQIPDAINPAEWYNSSVEMLSGDEVKEASAEGASTEAPSAETQDAKFPNISRVEKQRQARDNLSGGLVADVEGRQRAAAVSLQGSAVKPLAPSVANVPGAIQPAPPAVPTVAVTTAQPIAPEPVAPMLTASAAPATSMYDNSALTHEEKDFETRLKRRLAEIRARANQSNQTMQNVLSDINGSMGTNQHGTVFVSSTGVSTSHYGAPSASIPSPFVTPSQFTGGSVQNAAALPVPGRSVKVATIQFANGSARLSASDLNILRQVKALAAQKGGQIRIVGHASSRTRNLDPLKRKMANFEISIKRADKVARELVRLGLSKDNLLIGAVSDIMPQYHEYMPSGEAGNRRTEIYLDS